VGWQAADSRELMLQLDPKGHLSENKEGLILLMKSEDSLLENSLLLRGDPSCLQLIGHGQPAFLKVHQLKRHSTETP
jgi:hypothetical protein